MVGPFHAAAVRTPQPSPEQTARHLRRVGWSYAEYSGLLGYTVELSRDGRVILASAPTPLLAWQFAERAAVGTDGYED